jgi:ubiquinone/menaquinone biosynthesis C-methylase UbiE
MWFIQQNRTLYYRFRRHFAHVADTVSDQYPEIVGTFAREGSVVADVGGGAQCALVTTCPDSQIIALDISAAELARNRDVEDRRVADVTKHMPLADNSCDIVASRYVIEHLRGVEHFAEESYRVLKPGGVFITLFPNKYAPFSLLNRALSVSAARKVAYALKEEAARWDVFPAYYEFCSPRVFSRLLETKGFTSIDVKVTYSQSTYYSFFFPLAAFFLCYEWILTRLNLISLSAHVLVCATKPPAVEGHNEQRQRFLQRSADASDVA